MRSGGRKYKQCCLNKKSSPDEVGACSQANTSLRSGRAAEAAQLLARATQAAPLRLPGYDELGIAQRVGQSNSTRLRPLPQGFVVEFCAVCAST